MAYGYVTPDNGFTVEFWFSHTALPTYPEAIVNQQTQDKGARWSTAPDINGRHFIVYLNQTTGALVVEVRNEAGTVLLSWIDPSPGSYPTDGAWHFCCVRIGSDKRTLTVYLDGEELTQTLMPSMIDWKPGAMSWAGAYATHLGNWGTYLYNGGLAYCVVWDRAINATAIQEHYAAGSGGAVYYGDTEVERLDRLCEFAGVPINARKFDAALTTLQGLQISGVNALSAFQQAAADAGGVLYADGQAALVYQNRRHRYNTPVIVTLTELTSSGPEVGMSFSTDDTKVFNDVRASRPNGGTARIRNKESEEEYGPRVYTITLAVTDDEEMRAAANWVAQRYGIDRVRIDSVSLRAESSDLIQELTETIQIGDRIAFDNLPNNTPSDYLEYVVEGFGMSADFKEQTWTLTLELSPADLYSVMQVGTSTLGDGTRIAY